MSDTVQTQRKALRVALATCVELLPVVARARPLTICCFCWPPLRRDAGNRKGIAADVVE
jgi:hypothetical protein